MYMYIQWCLALEDALKWSVCNSPAENTQGSAWQARERS